MSRLSRVEGKLDRVEQVLQAEARTAAMIHRAEVGQLLRETVPVEELIDRERESARRRLGDLRR